MENKYCDNCFSLIEGYPLTRWCRPECMQEYAVNSTDEYGSIDGYLDTERD
jgi:hypothetical protein